MSVRSGLGSLSLRSSLLVTAAVAVLVAVVVGTVGVLRMNDIASRAERIYAEALVPLSTVEDIQQLIWHSRWASLSNLTATDPAKAAEYARETIQQLDLVSERLQAYDRLTVSAPERAAMAAVQQGWAQYLELREQSAALKQAGNTAEWQEFRSTTLNPSITKVVADLDALKALSEQYAQASAAAAHSAAETGRTAIILVLVAGVLLAGVFALGMARALSRRLGALEAVLAAMAEGDLTSGSRTPPSTRSGGCPARCTVRPARCGRRYGPWPRPRPGCPPGPASCRRPVTAWRAAPTGHRRRSSPSTPRPAR
jgi:methyl-accepting chemotaxis protein